MAIKREHSSSPSPDDPSPSSSPVLGNVSHPDSSPHSDLSISDHSSSADIDIKPPLPSSPILGRTKPVLSKIITDLDVKPDVPSVDVKGKVKGNGAKAGKAAGAKKKSSATAAVTGAGLEVAANKARAKPKAEGKSKGKNESSGAALEGTGSGGTNVNGSWTNAIKGEVMDEVIAAGYKALSGTGGLDELAIRVSLQLLIGAVYRDRSPSLADGRCRPHRVPRRAVPAYNL